MLDAKQLREWEIYYSLEPFGSLENDIQNAYTRKTMLEAMGATRKDKKPFNISDFSMDDMRETAYKNRIKPKAEQKPEDVITIFRTLQKTQRKEVKLKNTPPKKRLVKKDD